MVRLGVIFARELSECFCISVPADTACTHPDLMHSMLPGMILFNETAHGDSFMAPIIILNDERKIPWRFYQIINYHFKSFDVYLTFMFQGSNSETVVLLCNRQ